jgi:hypothetical protein
MTIWRVSWIFAGLLEVARIDGNRVEGKMVSVVAASAKTTE